MLPLADAAPPAVVGRPEEPEPVVPGAVRVDDGDDRRHPWAGHRLLVLGLLCRFLVVLAGPRHASGRAAPLLLQRLHFLLQVLQLAVADDDLRAQRAGGGGPSARSLVGLVGHLEGLRRAGLLGAAGRAQVGQAVEPEARRAVPGRDGGPEGWRSHDALRRRAGASKRRAILQLPPRPRGAEVSVRVGAAGRPPRGGLRVDLERPRPPGRWRVLVDVASLKEHHHRLLVEIEALVEVLGLQVLVQGEDHVIEVHLDRVPIVISSSPAAIVGPAAVPAVPALLGPPFVGGRFVSRAAHAVLLLRRLAAAPGTQSDVGRHGCNDHLRAWARQRPMGCALAHRAARAGAPSGGAQPDTGPRHGTRAPALTE
mmetsp:Transcript_77831/g.168374  ORF Transcript_77831/g.168374 Transcript_77831/m.168374 type:complete len:368 (-) Transcript_77831:73-1176(-)